MTNLARLERDALCDTLLATGPDAPTLCSPWTTADLAAHLVLREHFSKWGEERLAAEAAKGLPHLVDRLRNDVPLVPWRVPGLRTLLNGVEWFIHHEDVRRAQPEWTPRTLPPADQDTLWSAAALYARRGAGRRGVVLRRTDGAGDERRIGAAGRTVEGEPMELLLWLARRRDVARVTVS